MELTGSTRKWFLILFALGTVIMFLNSKEYGLIIKRQQVVTSSASSVPRNPDDARTCSQDERIQFVREQCKARGLYPDPDEPHNGLVYDKFKLIYCPVFKSGTVTFKTLFLRLTTGNDSMVISKEHPEIENDGIRRLEFLSTEERKQVIKEYKKLLVVRHPFERLVSAYDNKLSKPSFLNNEILKKHLNLINNHLMHRIENYVNGSFDPNVHTISFNDFISLVHQNYAGGFRDVHWLSIEDLCHPCRTDFDFIMRLETMSDDIKPLFDYLNKFTNKTLTYDIEQKNVHHPVQSSEDKKAQVIQRYQSFSKAVMDSLHEVYQRDFDLFGYSWSTQTGSSCSMNSCC